MATCPHCRYESRGVSTCPLCGTVLSVDGGPQQDALPLPRWEEPGAPLLAGFLDTWRTSVFDPFRFFPRVRWEGPAGRPVLYMLVVVMIGALFSLFWQAAGVEPSTVPEGWGPVAPGGLAALEFFLTPFAALLGLALWGAILHLFVLMLAPGRRGFGATIRVICYAAGPAVFTVVPIAGGLVALVWPIVLTVFGLREAHHTTGGRAAAIVLVPIALLFVVLLGLGLLLIRAAEETLLA